MLRLNQADAGRPTLFCVHPVSGTLVGYYPLARALAPHWQVFGLQNRQLLQPAWRDQSLEQMARDYVRVMPVSYTHLDVYKRQQRLHAALQAVLEQHDALRLRFQQQGDSWRQRYAAEAETLELRVERLSLIHI